MCRKQRQAWEHHPAQAKEKRPKPQGWGERAFEQGCEYARTFFSFDQQLVFPHAEIA